MDGLNQVTLIGSVGKDAETKFIGENSQVAKFSLATNKTFKDKTGEKKTLTEWHNIEVWGETAKFAGNFIKKGSTVLVLGEIKYETYEDKEGKTQYRTKILANKVQLFPKAAATTSTDGATAAASPAKAQTEEYVAANATTSANLAGAAEDDLPF